MGPDGVDGLFIGWSGEGFHQLGLQCIGFLATWVYAFAVTIVICLIVKYTTGLRTSEETEDKGLDLTLHAEAAYHMELEPTGTLK
jgi:Amt family ammonium transporter